MAAYSRISDRRFRWNQCAVPAPPANGNGYTPKQISNRRNKERNRQHIQQDPQPAIKIEAESERENTESDQDINDRH